MTYLFSREGQARLDKGLLGLVKGPAGCQGQLRVSEHFALEAKGQSEGPRGWELGHLVEKQPEAFQLLAAGVGDMAMAEVTHWRGFHVPKDGGLSGPEPPGHMRAQLL